MQFASTGLSIQSVMPWRRLTISDSPWVVRETAPLYGQHAEAPERHDGADEQSLTSLGEEIMTLAERLHAETHRWLMLIAEFDRLAGWKLYGFASCADWLAYSTRLDKGTAREKVRVARALAGLPETSAAMSRGELSFSQVRALTRVADGENELELLEHARSTSASGLERMVRSWRRLGREDEAAFEERRHAMRYLTSYPDDQGMVQVRALLPPEVGAGWMRLVERAMDKVYRGSVPGTTPEQLRADAFALIIDRMSDVGFENVGDAIEGSASEVDADDALDVSAETPREQDASDAGGRGATPDRASAETSREAGPGDSALRGGLARHSERYLVVLHVDETTLDAAAEPGRSELEDGTRVSAETSRRIACDAPLVRVVHSANGEEARVEAKTRTVPLRMRRALEIRDQGCRFPGCGCRFTDAHHMKHWADGGATRLDNLILLCRTHHRSLHEGGFELKQDPERPGRPAFYSPGGIRIPEVPPKMTIGGRAIGARGVCADGERAAAESPRWEVDVPLALYLGALEGPGEGITMCRV